MQMYWVLLVVGVLLWAGYLWARDRRVGPFGRPGHRAAIVAGTALLTLAVAAPALGSSWVPPVPTEPAHAFAGRINVAASVGQNPSGQGGVDFLWLPAGSGCLDAVPISRGQVTVCWSADVERRPTRDSDQFHFRIALTYEGPPAAPSWLMAEIRLVDAEGSVVALRSNDFDGAARSTGSPRDLDVCRLS